MTIQQQTGIYEVIERKREEILEFTRSLVAIPTENPPGNKYEQCQELIVRQLDKLGLPVELHDVPDGGVAADTPSSRPRFIKSVYGTGEKILYFHGHYDVVPAATEGQFTPHVKGANLHGRGSSDMKSGLAAMLYAVAALKETGTALNGRIALVFVPDEETGGKHGSQHLDCCGVPDKNAVGMLTPEPTSGVIWNASRGAITLRVTMKGKPAHVGLQYMGVNAFERMLTVGNALKAIKEEVEARVTAFNIQPRAARNSILMMGGLCQGGSAFNLVPEECSFTVDRRINPEENLQEEKERLLKFFAEQREQGMDIEVEILQEGNSAGVAQDGPLARGLADAIHTVTGKAAEFEMCPGLLEIRFYVEKGVPAFAYGPGLLSVSHGPNEFVPIRNIYDCACIYAMTAARMLS